MSVYGDLREKRERLVHLAEGCLSRPSSCMDVQRLLAEEILASERDGAAEPDTHRWHRHLLRVIGDSLAWLLLDPGTILALSLNPGPPHSLSNQGVGWKNTIDRAEEFVRDGSYVVVSDLTNMLRIGDLVVIPEGGADIWIVEEKVSGFDTRSLTGRRRRQMQRMLGAIRGMRPGGGVEESSSADYDIAEEVEARFGPMETIVADVIGGMDPVAVQVGEGDILWGMDFDEERFDWPSIEAATSSMAAPLVCCLAVPFEESDARFPPPPAWPIPVETKVRLLERDVLLMHVVDVGQLVGYRDGFGLIVEVLSNGRRVTGVGVRTASGDGVRVDASCLEYSGYGLMPLHELAGACTRAAMAAVNPEEVEEIDVDSVALVATHDEAVALFAAAERPQWVQLPVEVYQEMRDLFEARREGGRAGPAAG